jgi:SAM-dependent methyltransferase
MGHPFFCELGPVTGVDLSLESLFALKQQGWYEGLVHADVRRLPFPDSVFEYVVSADFFGHVRVPAKDEVIAEMRRVLAPGGIIAHVIETDSANACFRFAHRFPDLFRKYFVEQIGGHFGLEMPGEAIRRFEEHGFQILEVRKMWGPVWETREYVRQFGNEYAEHSRFLRTWVAACRLLSSNPATMIPADALLGVISAIVDRVQPLDSAQGIFLVARRNVD